MLVTVGSGTSMRFGAPETGLPLLAPMHCAKQWAQFGPRTGSVLATELEAETQGGERDAPGRERSCFESWPGGSWAASVALEGDNSHQSCTLPSCFLPTAEFHPTAWMERQRLTVAVESRLRKHRCQFWSCRRVRAVPEGNEAVDRQDIGLMVALSRHILGQTPE